MWSVKGASQFDQRLNSSVSESAEHDLFGEIYSAVYSDASMVTETDTSLFASEQAYCERALG
ncbi:hypothetical protein AV889_28310 [Escherichia coli]|nr:hypothetical protein AV889_28310 [Escherichia coli]